MRTPVYIEGRFDGMVNGAAIVPAGAEAEIAGMVNGTLVVEPGARVHISGMVTVRSTTAAGGSRCRGW